MQVIEWETLDFPSRLAIKRASERSFLNFTRLWFEIIQGEKMLVNWHHRLMAQKMEQLIEKRLDPSNLIVNIPPGGTKTEFFSIHLPAYTNTLAQTNKIKRFRNLNVSFADSLVKRNSRRTRDIIASDEYQELWPCKFGVNQAEEWEIVDSSGRSVGQTISKSAGGQITGGRGGFYGPEFSGLVLLDDYNKPDDMFSETKRNKANTMLTNTLRSRRGDKSKEHPTPFVLIQQRLHTNDATGFMLSGGMGMEFHHVVIPALINEEYIENLEQPWRDLCWQAVRDTESVNLGGVKHWSYWPEMEYVGDLLTLWEKDEYTFLSQYQQAPRQLTGGLIDADWFGRYERLPEMVWRGVYVDTAQKKGEQHDYSVFEHWGLGTDGNAYLIDLVRDKFDSDELLRAAEESWNKWHDWSDSSRLRYMAIEDKSSGTGLIQSLKNKNRIPIEPVPRGPSANKVVRCLDVQSYIKTGRVLIPALSREDGTRVTHVLDTKGKAVSRTDWVLAFLAEASDFSSDDSHQHDDQLDPMFDALADMLIEKKKNVGILLPGLK